MPERKPPRSDEEIERSEVSYTQGHRMAWLMMLGMCLRELGYEDEAPEVLKARMVREREEAVHALRSACESLGDNDWPSDLNLADIINKHLVDYLL